MWQNRETEIGTQTSAIAPEGSAAHTVVPMVRMAPEVAETKLSVLIEKFEQTGTPVNVSFREILRAPSARDRATHDLHSYPAKLLVNIPSFFLSTSLCRPNDLVLDPFCGSGTVLLEAVLAGRNATGADANPLARLLTRAKLTPITPSVLRSARSSFFRRLSDAPRRDYPEVLNLNYWFYPHVRRDLLRLLECISRMRNEVLREFFSVVFSACIKDVSLADPRLSVPVRLKENQYPKNHWLRDQTNRRLRRLRTINVVSVFSKRLDDNIRRLERLASWPHLGRNMGVGCDARSLAHLGSESVDLVITSPPYLGAQKYVRASSLHLTWLGLCNASHLRALEDKNIGREHYLKASYEKPIFTGLPKADALLKRVRKLYPLRAHIGATYLCEMRQALREMNRVLKPMRHAVLVVGESHVCGIKFPTPTFLAEMAKEEGFSLRLHLVDTIRSRSLMTKRHHTAGRIDSESVLLLRKDT